MSEIGNLRVSNRAISPNFCMHCYVFVKFCDSTIILMWNLLLVKILCDGAPDDERLLELWNFHSHVLSLTGTKVP